MTDQPLQPFAPPAFFESGMYGSTLGNRLFSTGAVVIGILLVVFIIWAVYTLVAVYHWFKYSNASWIIFPAVAAHFFISFALMAYALSGNAFFLMSYLP